MRRNRQSLREGCEGRKSPFPEHPCAGQCEGGHSIKGFSGTTGVGLHSDQRQTALCDLPCKCFHVRTAPLVTTALLNLRLYEHQHIIPSFIPCLPRACQEAQCPLSTHSTDEPPLTVNFTTCVSLLTQYTPVPLFLPRSGMSFKLIQDLIRVFIAHIG